MLRCASCILPDTFPDIKFDKNGVCNSCRKHEKKEKKKDYSKLNRKLEKILSWAKSQNKKYDCLVPFSGGMDSSYVMYLCNKVYGMKTLAVHFDNALKTDVAYQNISRIVKKTDCGFVSYGPSPEVMRKLYKEFLVHTGQFCFPCDMGTWATVRKAAEDYDIPLIITGYANRIESGNYKIYSCNNRLFKNIASRVITKREIHDFLSLNLMQKLLRRIRKFRLARYRRQIMLPEFIRWNDNVIKNTIEKELGWQGKSGSRYDDHIDCAFSAVKNYLHVHKWGFGEKTLKYCCQIREGTLNRKEGMEKIQREEKGIPPELKEFMRQIDVTAENIRQAKNRTHIDYL